MEETARLTLAFVGEQEVHRNNARSLLDDFVDGWQKQHRKGEVKVILHDPGFATDTFKDLDDWGGTAGYDVTYAQTDEVIPALLEESDARLILVGDPNDDDDLYAVAEEAAKYRIQTRSLINGLEKVVFDDEDFEDDLAGLHEVDVETGEGWAEDEDLTDEAAALLAAVPDVEDLPDDEAAPDLDLLAALADDGEVEAQEEIKQIGHLAGVDVSPFDTWTDAVAAIRMGTTVVSAEQFDELAKEEKYDGLAEFSSLGEDPEPEVLTPTRVYTRDYLESLNFDEVKAIGLECGIASGRGMKHGVFVTKILQATGVETDPPKRKRGKPKLEAVEPVAGEATEPAESDNVHPIRAENTGSHDLQAIADRLRELANEIELALDES